MILDWTSMAMEHSGIPTHGMLAYWSAPIGGEVRDREWGKVKKTTVTTKTK